MGQALYRKYRSKSLSEILGQEHITTALEQAIQTGRISHAYLFTGPRGTGKTSIARILAYAINELPYSSDPHLDIIEIDAASNRRIDEIRDLRDKVYVAPTSAKYKVYIIDEVHMLTREAFNALLKTLEEPPAHVVFILATTDAHKLPETIISRTQRYNFRPVETAKVTAHLTHIAKQEKLKADPEALELLARHGEGSFRDSISMLDQASNHGSRITIDTVQSQLGIAPDDAVAGILNNLSGADLSAPVRALEELYNNGFRAATIAEQLSYQLRQQIADQKTSVPVNVALSLLKDLLNVASAHSPERYLELVLMQAIAPTATPVLDAVEVKLAVAPEVNITAPAKAPVAPAVTAIKKPKTVQAVPEPAVEATPKPAKSGQTSTMVLDETAWNEVLAELKKQYNTIYGIVRMAHTDFSEPGTVGLGFAFAFHQKRITDAKNRKIVTDTIAHVTGQHITLVCTVSKDPKPRAASKPAPPNDAALQDISSVFGGGELL